MSEKVEFLLEQILVELKILNGNAAAAQQTAQQRFGEADAIMSGLLKQFQGVADGR